MGNEVMYGEEEKLCLKWNDFHENAISAFGTLRDDREFADITLACEDGQQVEAHKVILASSSPFFLNLLRRNKHPHPLIYMRGLKSEDLVAMIDFIYFGEAIVKQENLDFFLAVADELQLKGLMGSGTKDEVGEVNNKPITKKKSWQPRTNTKQEVIITDTFSSIANVETSPPLEGTVAVTDMQDLDIKIKSMMMFSENHAGGNHGKARICKVCGKEGEMGQIFNHIEANHITGVSYTCNICGTTTRSKNAMRKHKTRNHTKNEFQCITEKKLWQYILPDL